MSADRGVEFDRAMRQGTRQGLNTLVHMSAAAANGSRFMGCEGCMSSAAQRAQVIADDVPSRSNKK